MKREVKYRVWDKENKIMSEGVPFLWFITGEPYDMSFPKNEQTLPLKDFIFYIDDFDIIQETGIKNSYAGDILGNHSVQYGDQSIGHIELDTDLAAFVLIKTNGGWELLYEFWTKNPTVEIIGNIYENPELLNNSNEETTTPTNP